LNRRIAAGRTFKTRVRFQCPKAPSVDEFRYIGVVPASERPRIGYARVSTALQNANLQLDALSDAGCKRVFEDHASGARSARPGLHDALDFLREGDVLVVWRLDRLGRSLSDLVTTVNALEDRGVGFVSLTESIDTSTPGGRLVFHVFASLAEFEKDLIRERTQAGLASARARGRKGGRPSVMDEDKIRIAQKLLNEVGDDGRPTSTVSEVAVALGVSRATIYRMLQRASADDPGD
jgi:DNA invertase Pin-like site-specific DNA recombinase